MTTSDMVRKLCEKKNISIAELCRRIGQTPQNFNKKLQRETVSFEEMMEIAEVLDVGYEQAFVLPDGEKIDLENIRRSFEMGSIKEAFRGFGGELLENIRNSQRERLDDAAFEERILGIKKATAAMIGAGIEDNIIIQMLQKYWDLRLSEAKSFVKRQNEESTY